MAEYGDDGLDDDYYYEDDYLYVEDSYAVADELAENAIPNPPYLEYLDNDYDDFDPYDFWMDTEYGVDEYYDINSNQPVASDSSKTGTKRRRASGVNEKEHSKRRKTASDEWEVSGEGAGQASAVPVVRWMSLAARLIPDDQEIAGRVLQPYALWPDWREQFKDAPGFTARPAAVTEMVTSRSRNINMAKEHSLDQDEDVPDQSDDLLDQDEDLLGQNEDGPDEGEDLLEQDEYEGDDDGEEGIDPNLLRAALVAKLSGSGIAGGDQAAFMQSLMQMLANGGEVDEDALENLTTSLLDQASQGGADSSMTQWLSQQGVRLEQADDDTQSQSTETQAAPKNFNTNQDTSPRDSAISEANMQTESLSTKPHAKSRSGVVQSLKPQANGPPESLSGSMLPTKGNRPLDAHVSKESTLPRTKKSDNTAASALPLPEDGVTPAATGDSAASATNLATKSNGSQAKSSRKRKASPESNERVPEQPQRKLRNARSLANFATPTASSQGKAAEPARKTTRSGRPRK